MANTPLAKLLVDLRGSRSRADVARAAGLHPRSLAKLERGERSSPRFETLRAIAAALEVDVRVFAPPEA